MQLRARPAAVEESHAGARRPATVAIRAAHSAARNDRGPGPAARLSSCIPRTQATIPRAWRSFGFATTYTQLSRGALARTDLGKLFGQLAGEHRDTTRILHVRKQRAPRLQRKRIDAGQVVRRDLAPQGIE